MSDPLIRHWDPKGEYEGAVLRVYPHWCLEVSWNQHTLGSYIIFLRRNQGSRLLSQTTAAEMVELQMAMEDIECALRRHDLFRADHFNYLQMGNQLPQLHLHGIPRYEEIRFFGNQPWTDDAWGRPPQWTTLRSDRELINMLVRELQPLLPK